MLELLRHAVAAIPMWIFPIALGVWMVYSAGWSFIHARELQDERLRGWPGAWAQIFPRAWVEQKERSLRSRSDRVLLRIGAAIGVVLGILLILWGLINA